MVVLDNLSLCVVIPLDNVLFTKPVGWDGDVKGE